MDKGDCDTAIEHYEKALEIGLEQSGTQRHEVAALYNNLGSAYQGKSDYDRAIEHYEKALEIGLEQSGTQRPKFAIVHNNLGSAYEDIDDYDRAIEHYEKALEIDLDNLGPEHPEVAIRYNDLGVKYNHITDYDKATEYFQKALRIGLERLGENHPHTKIFQNNLDSLRGKAAEGDALILEDYMDQTDCPECGKTYQIDMRGKHVRRKHKAWVDCECGIRFSYTKLKLRPLKQEDDSPLSQKINSKSEEDARVGYSLSTEKIKLLGKRLLWVVIIFAVGAYFLNGYLQNQAKERAKKEKAERFERSVRSDVAEMVSRFDAVSDWPEKLLKGKSVWIDGLEEVNWAFPSICLTTN
jgi:tetratricopeptide (TPR) repeat protein